MCNARRCGQGGLGANKSPRWSAERRASPARGLRKRICAGCETPATARLRASSSRYASAGLRYWPAKGAAQAPERLSALRTLTLCGGKPANLGVQMPREKDDACAQISNAGRLFGINLKTDSPLSLPPVMILN